MIASGQRQTDLFEKQGQQYVSVDISKAEEFDKLPQEDVYAVIDFAAQIPSYRDSIRLKGRDFITSELSIKETQAISLEILHVVSEICEKQHLRYALIYGTLIGAVRHHGYIPWDDDVDIICSLA